MVRILERWSRKQVDVAARGFVDGSQDIPSGHFLQQIEANTQEAEATLRERSESRLRKLEGRAETLSHFETQARERWEFIQDRNQLQHSQVLVPLFLLVLACLALIAEATLLAPVFDMFGVADPTAQFLVALAYGFTSVVILHLVLAAEEIDSPVKSPLQITSAVLLLVLVLLGVLRAQELAFAARITGNPLGEFLSGHPILSQVVIAAFSVLFPLCGAFAFHHGASQLRHWWQFRRARRCAQALKSKWDKTRKQVESARNRLEQNVAALHSQREECKASYLHHWEFGTKCGAKKGSCWFVWAKVAAAALGVLVVMRGLLPLTGVRVDWESALLTASFVAVLAAVYFYRNWEHPKPAELLRRANIEFRDGGQKASRANLGPEEFKNCGATAFAPARSEGG